MTFNLKFNTPNYIPFNLKQGFPTYLLQWQHSVKIWRVIKKSYKKYPDIRYLPSSWK